MVWVPKMGKCCMCGKEIMLKSSVHKYCADCGNIMRKIKTPEGWEREIAKQVAIRCGMNPDEYAGKHTECRRKESCVYGGRQYCEYMAITGHSRLLAGYPIKDGKCDLYKRGRRKPLKPVDIISTSPVLGPGKMGEV